MQNITCYEDQLCLPNPYLDHWVSHHGLAGSEIGIGETSVSFKLLMK